MTRPTLRFFRPPQFPVTVADLTLERIEEFYDDPVGDEE